MTHAQIAQLPLFPEQRACKQPTAARTLKLFSGLARHHLYSHASHLNRSCGWRPSF